jgi:hypothetical protein
MTVPVINAVINFGTGPSFAQAMILGTGILDTNILADSAALVVDVSNLINRIETNRGRTALSDSFQTGSLTLRIVDQNGDFNPQNTSSPYFTYLTPMKKSANKRYIQQRYLSYIFRLYYKLRYNIPR